jgi:hypothetical protein
MRRSYDSEGINVEGYQVAPEGIYNLAITKVTDIKDGVQWKTKNGDDYVSVETQIDDAGEYLGKKIWHGVTFMNDKNSKGAGMAIQFLKFIGEPWEGMFDIDTDHWIGKRFKAKVRIGKDNQGRQRNEIAWLIDPNSAEDDGVPF